LAVALGIRACLAGQRVIFRTATEWVALLADAQRQGRLDDELRRLERYPLLICDEVGYIPFDPQAANLMFMLVSRRYERASLIVTSNKPFSAWGEIFGDDATAAAMIDRLVHHAEILSHKGDSYAAVVGASFGGCVALQVATNAPDRVAGLALLASALPEFERSPELRAHGEEEDALWEAGDLEGLVELNVRAWVRDPATAGQVAEMVRTACELQLGRPEPDEIVLPVELGAIPVPTLAISAGLDFADFARIADRIAAEVPDAQRAEVPDAGHMIALERPDAAAALLAPFLERVSA
jgi:pimeloyl-ACP methyl ester carboxylesterase